jgi:hypothetical protein
MRKKTESNQQNMLHSNKNQAHPAFRKKFLNYTVLILVFLGICVTGWLIMRKASLSSGVNSENTNIQGYDESVNKEESEKEWKMPVYGRWQSFTTKDGLPSDKVYCVRIDKDKVYAGTHDGLAVYENGKWRTYTKEDGLSHNGVLSIDISSLTGDVWIGTLSGLTRWSGGKFEIFNQFNSGLPNDLVYCVICDGKDVWVATGGGAGHYDTFTRQWEIFTELNAPMHEPWTYGVSAGAGRTSRPCPVASSPTSKNGPSPDRSGIGPCRAIARWRSWTWQTPPGTGGGVGRPGVRRRFH